MLYTLDPRLQVPKDMILPVGPKRKRTNKREEPQTLFAGESAESIIRMVKAARQEGSEDKPEDNNGPEREYQPPDIEDPWDMSGVIQRLALSEAPGTTRPGEDAGRVEPRADDPARPVPSGPRSGEEQDWANDAQSVDDSVHPSIATALESVTTGTSIKGLLLGGRTKQPRTQVESRKEHSADVVRPKAVQLSGREHRTRSEERVREGAGHSHQVGQSRTTPPRTHHNLILTNKHEKSYLV